VHICAVGLLRRNVHVQIKDRGLTGVRKSGRSPLTADVKIYIHMDILMSQAMFIW